jgi:hypothetical protein
MGCACGVTKPMLLSFVSCNHIFTDNMVDLSLSMLLHICTQLDPLSYRYLAHAWFKWLAEQRVSFVRFLLSWDSCGVDRKNLLLYTF